MIRQVVTSRDVEDAPGGELQVGLEDVITPSAHEAASRRGVRIVRSDGSPAAPAPAVQAPPTPPAVAPPVTAPEAVRGTAVIVSVFGRNRPHVLAEIAGAIAHEGGNILDISQRIVRDYFSLLVIVDTAEVADDFRTFKSDLEALSREGDYFVSVAHEAVFRAMHRV